MEKLPKKFIAKKFWGAAAIVLGNGHWIAVGVTVLLALSVLILIQESEQQFQLFRLDRSSLLAVMGSFLASAIFFLVTDFVLRIRRVRETAENMYFSKIHNTCGVVDAFLQRGDREAMKEYEHLLTHATQRIWAVGITNHRFTAQHSRSIAARLASCRGLDVRVAFLDPEAGVVFAENGCERRESLPQVQYNLEKNARTFVDFSDQIARYINTIREEAGSAGKLRGRLRIYKIIGVCYFTCFVIDDAVFFFPMLGRQESGQDPTLKVAAGSVLGHVVIDHFTKLFDARPYSRVAFDSKSPKTKAHSKGA